MKTLRLGLSGLAALLLVALGLLAALWVWGGTNTSLASALARVAPYLPAGQTLEARDVSGSLRSGGQIGLLRWQQGELTVEAHDVQVGWQLRPLLAGELRLDRLSVRQLRIDDRRPPTAALDRAPPTDLRLPLRVQAAFSINTLDWVGPPPLSVNGLTGRYRFDNAHHQLELDPVSVASGTYRLKAQVQARAPMKLSAQLDGAVKAPRPSSAKVVTVQAHAELAGTLAGDDARLALQAQLRPELGTPVGQSLRATLSADLQPWKAQPVAQARAQWQALDLAALWPQAPHTQLTGNARLTPSGSAWQASIHLSNTQSGPWNQQRLPLERLDAQVGFDAGHWSVQSLQAHGAGGQIQARGQTSLDPTAPAASTPWQLEVTARGINPAAIDTRLEAVQLNGQLKAWQSKTGVHFDAELQPDPAQAQAAPTRSLRGVRLRTIQANGVWRAPALQIDHLRVQTQDAQLEGSTTYHTRSQAINARLALTLPGAQASVNGNIARERGEGKLSAKVDDAALVAQWLARWPGLPAGLKTTLFHGDAEVNAHWQGGWQQRGQTLQIKAAARSSQLDWRRANQTEAQSMTLRDTQVDLAGTPAALRLSLRSHLETSTLAFALQTSVQGGRLNTGDWQASVHSAGLTLEGRKNPGRWTLNLVDPLRLRIKPGEPIRALDISAGTARLSGPQPGSATLSWQAANWSRQRVGGVTTTAWHTQGSLGSLPLAWLELLGQTELANLGLRGDLAFGAQWDASNGHDGLKLHATLARHMGDMQLQTGDGPGDTLSAGLRDARLTLDADGNGDELRAKLIWDSERAGQVRVDLSTRLPRHNGLPRWSLAAPLAGTVSAQLPPIGAWSLLAPPGWRLRGTLDAQATLSGTLGAPQWLGTLMAQDMAVRSVVDGIDFSQGRLRAKLQGQRLEIEEFTLQGAGGSRGGQLALQGSLQWLAPDLATAKAGSRLRLSLDATLKALRLSERVDRQLVLSGKLSAQLADTALSIRGALKVDQALFILPDDSAPQLGDDVIVRGARTQTDLASQPAVGARVTPNLLITLDLGPNFAIRGRGLITRLVGGVELRSNTDTQLQPRLVGTLRTVQGTYKAYGQQLEIEQGVLRFHGAYDNPALDILALRPNLQQRVGVQISGTARSPVVRLYSDPELPEAQKLAWLVLGRSAASGGAESALLQQAAMALLGGNGKSMSSSLAEALGLDEVSVRGGAGAADGSNGAGGATVTLGKRVSRDFYLAYESGLVGALGTLYVFYDLSRRFTLRAQTGSQSAVDLIFTIRYD